MLTLEELPNICDTDINFIEFANISHKIKDLTRMERETVKG